MRLVDADDLLIDLNNFVSYETAYEYEEVKECVLSAPTIEAEPIIHAHWVTRSDNCGMFYCCSNCGEDLPRYYTERPTWDNPFPNMESIDKTPRCPHCGAKMNKEVEG